MQPRSRLVYLATGREALASCLDCRRPGASIGDGMSLILQAGIRAPPALAASAMPFPIELPKPA